MPNAGWTGVSLKGLAMKRFGFLLCAMCLLSGCVTAEMFGDPKYGQWAYYGNEEASKGVVYLDGDTALTPSDEWDRYYATSGTVDGVIFVANCVAWNQNEVCTSSKIAMMDLEGKLLNDFGEYDYPQLVVNVTYPASVMHVALDGTRSKFPMWAWRGDLPSTTRIDNIFVEDRLLVMQNGLYGFLDRSGKPVVAPRFHALGEYSNGKAFAISDQGIGSVDIYGQFIPETYACITYYDEKYKKINSGGQLVNYQKDLRTPNEIYITDLYKDAVEKRPDASQVCIGGKWGLVDMNDKVIVPPEYDDIVIEEGSGKLWARNNSTKRVAYYNTDGTQVIGPEYAAIFLGEAFAIVQNDDGKYALLNTEGKRVTEFEYDAYQSKGDPTNVSYFLTSEYAVMNKDGKWGVLKPTGEVAVPFQYEALTAESEGLIGFKRGKRWGVIDTTNKEILSPIYGSVGLFEDGRATAVLAGDEINIYRDDNARNAWHEKFHLEQLRANEDERAEAAEQRRQELKNQERLEAQMRQHEALRRAEIDRLTREIADLKYNIAEYTKQYNETKDPAIEQTINDLQRDLDTRLMLLEGLENQ